jgi:hypothetical protein
MKTKMFKTKVDAEVVTVAVILCLLVAVVFLACII